MSPAFVLIMSNYGLTIAVSRFNPCMASPRIHLFSQAKPVYFRLPSVSSPFPILSFVEIHSCLPEVMFYDENKLLVAVLRVPELLASVCSTTSDESEKIVRHIRTINVNFFLQSCMLEH